jgi:hypothetical protein
VVAAATEAGETGELTTLFALTPLGCCGRGLRTWLLLFLQWFLRLWFICGKRKVKWSLEPRKKLRPDS